ncbi:ParB N-terminal domain-containing protein [Priestia sp. YIM B13446]|uniref:ParB N-terminal domain-containing protein n=1 Tax=unclassified Priestia TaxID=2800374 RepID=UPI003672F9E1
MFTTEKEKLGVFNDLEAVPINNLFFHEDYDESRLENIKESILAKGMLLNPPLALKVSENKYLILDGAHRTLALKSLGCNYMIIQKVDEENFHRLTVESWAHKVLRKELFKSFESKIPLELISSYDNDILSIEVYNENGTKKYYRVKDYNRLSPFKKYNYWREIVNSYKDSNLYERLVPNEEKVHNKSFMVVNFPALTIEDLKELCEEGILLPAGVTRCLFQGRILNLKLPLHFLMEAEINNLALNNLYSDWLNHLRFYQESVHVLDI